MLSVIILARNERANIGRVMESIDFADEVIVIDDESNDQTGEVAKKLGATVYRQAHLGDFALARNNAMKRAKGDWVLFVDADEVMTPALAKEIQSNLKNRTEDDEIVGYELRRLDTFWNREITHGEAGNTKILRLIKKGHGTWQGKVHETLNTIGDVKTLSGILMHYPHPTVADFLRHINFYSTLRAQELYEKDVKVTSFQIVAYPAGKFIVNYLLKLGFLDGPPGFVYAFMMSLHSFLVRAKCYQMQDK